MRHSQAILYMEGYEPEELSARRKARLEAHLATCPDCRKNSRESVALEELLEGIGPVLPRGFDFAVEAVRSRTLSEARALSGAPRLFARMLGPAFRPFVASVGVAALLGMVLLLVPARQDGAGVERLAALRGPGSEDFVVVRSGSEVRIEWRHNGRTHRVRTGLNPANLGHQADRVVNGKIWTDSTSPQEPGRVRYYAVD